MPKSSDIARDILDTRQDIIVAWLRGPEGAELLRLEKAFLALTGLEPPSINEISTRLNGSLLESEPNIGKAPTASEQVPDRVFKVVDAKLPRPVRAATKELLGSSDRVWSFDEMIGQFKRQGEQFKVKSLRDALRTAVLQLVNEGLAERVGKGMYRGISKASEVRAAESLRPLNLGRGEG